MATATCQPYYISDPKVVENTADQGKGTTTISAFKALVGGVEHQPQDNLVTKVENTNSSSNAVGSHKVLKETSESRGSSQKITPKEDIAKKLQ